MSDQLLKQVADGFSYNNNLLYLPNRFPAQALAQLDVLRRASNYRARWVVFPTDYDTPVQPYATDFYQCEVDEGAYLYGWTFYQQGSNGGNGFGVQVVDSSTGIPLFEDFTNGGGLAALYGSAGGSRMLPCLLTQPRLIMGPGLINVEITSAGPNVATCQLILHFTEPCLTIDGRPTKPASAKRVSK
jgi:hypothetical protein